MLLIRPSLFEENNGGEGGGGGGGEGGEGGEGKVSPELQLLTKSVGLLAQGLEEQKTVTSQIAQALAGLKPKEEEKPQPKTIQEEFEGVDLDAISNAELIELLTAKMMDRVEKLMEERTGKINEKIDGVATSFHAKNSQEEIAKLHEKNPDLMEWAPEVKKVMQENPTINVARALVIARSENPQKVAEMTKKYHQKSDDKKQRFFGITPTSSRDSGTGKMNLHEAAQKAFDEVFGAQGAEHLFTKDATVQ